MSKPRDRVRHRMAEILGISVDRIVDDARLTELVHSSFMLVELIIDLQEEFEVRFGQAEMQGVKTVGQLLDLFTRLLAAEALSASAG